MVETRSPIQQAIDARPQRNLPEARSNISLESRLVKAVFDMDHNFSQIDPSYYSAAEGPVRSQTTSPRVEAVSLEQEVPEQTTQAVTVVGSITVERDLRRVGGGYIRSTAEQSAVFAKEVLRIIDPSRKDDITSSLFTDVERKTLFQDIWKGARQGYLESAAGRYIGILSLYYLTLVKRSLQDGLTFSDIAARNPEIIPHMELVNEVTWNDMHDFNQGDYTKYDRPNRRYRSVLEYSKERGIEPPWEQPGSFNDILWAMYHNPRGEMRVPSVEELVIVEKRALFEFFGKEFKVPAPPQTLLRTLRRFQKQYGINSFHAHYLPNYTFTPYEELPGWQVMPRVHQAWFGAVDIWSLAQRGSLPTDTNSIYDGWYLIDSSVKQDLLDRYQENAEDYLSNSIKELQTEGEISKSVNPRTRFGVTSGLQVEDVLGVFASTHNIEGAIRNKRLIEFFVWGNMFYPEWGQTDSWEIMLEIDKTGSSSQYLMAGSSKEGGLGAWQYVDSTKAADIRFNPVIDFSK